MKKVLLTAGVLAYMLALGIETAHAQVSLDDAIQNAMTRLTSQSAVRMAELTNLHGTAPVAVVAIDADTVRMSDHIILRMLTTLLGMQVPIVERAQLEQVFAEQDLQMDGGFDDNIAASVAGGAGAHFIVMGSFRRVGNFHDFRVRIIDVNTHFITGMYDTRVQDSALIRDLMGADFTPVQRWGTLGLNFIPGLGSFVVMGDAFGGVFQLLTASAGVGLLAVGISQGLTYQTYNALFNRYEDQTNTMAVVSVIAGGALIATQVVFNIVRSHTYTRPAVRTASLVDPSAWNIALLPGTSGVDRVSLSYTLRF
ncbi:MAG: hypothetical protein FWB78_06705 [Treponema sp.]|nr:hypothetical protein [Treponema sp.]